MYNTLFLPLELFDMGKDPLQNMQTAHQLQLQLSFFLLDRTIGLFPFPVLPTINDRHT